MFDKNRVSNYTRVARRMPFIKTFALRLFLTLLKHLWKILVTN